ncbi:MAG: hypothetical protein MK085_08430, partial [Phycisphaerales bacterium]|nr:hypothetical protein [Phycisphaerales bacterium]
ALLEQVVNGDTSARPGSDAWTLRYGQLAAAWRDRILQPDDPRTRRLLEIVPQFSLELPDTWPADQSIPVLLNAQDWWPWGTEAMLELRWSANDGTPPTLIERIGLRNYAGGRRPHPMDLPPSAEWPEGGGLTIGIDIQVRHPAESASEEELADGAVEWKEWPVPLHQEIELVAPPDSETVNLAPLTSEAIDAVVQRIFAPGLRRWKGERRPFAIRFNTRATNQEASHELLFGCVVEIVERADNGEEHVRRRSRIWTTGNRNGPVRAGWTISEEDTEGLARRFDEDNRSDWVMRVRGDRDLALKALAQAGGNAEAFRGYWAGEIEFPLPISNEANQPFIRQWFFEDGPPQPE